ncbi:hypothetical protein A2592_01460 [Candidatus Kaiserbacteria bacterium RIFOXYD1_FULL_42_15]|uniref:Addiction module toxin RelE n=1 Tax=Candidatus Kaiserbacteria bacterium RIFOXYD1_FULL_42_15 TaxID=1798532 RepID=A0A1F6FPX4_9BACT|nr:MAG: hypothetical protein A2592_01460 [Candidatus Kaiserbacteria bacterium RIFOXYD1_FULL_42_15]
MKVIIEPDVVKFIVKLEQVTQTKIDRLIDLLKLYGNKLPMPYSKSLGYGLFELRIKGKQEVRLLYGFEDDGAIIVYGFLKKTQKTPKNILDLARKRIG